MKQYHIRKVSDQRFVIMEQAGREFLDIAVALSRFMAEKIIEGLENLQRPRSDMDHMNTMSFSPSALRDEAESCLNSGAYTDGTDDKAVLEWVCNTTDNELNEVAEYILNGDDIWTMWKSEFWDGIRNGYAKHQYPIG